MLEHFLTSINYAKLIEMQANQQSFAPVTKKGHKKITKKKSKAKVKTLGKRK